MSDAWRLFIAIDIPPEARVRIATVGQELRGAGWRGRWANPNGTHLTLKFYGDVPVDQIDSLRQLLSARLTLYPSVSLRVQGAGVFPKRGPVRVLWLGIAGEMDALGELQGEVERLSQELGYPAEHRPFAPHLTVARFRPEDAGTLSGLDAQLKRIGGLVPLPFPVSGVTLFRSKLRPSGAFYTPLAKFALKGESRR